jgi:hypothetical protein
MSSIEVMTEFAPYSDFIIAHENITWNIPDPYRDYFINVSSDITPKELARHLTEVNLESLLIPGLPNQITVIQTDAMDTATAKLDGLAATLLEILPTQRPFIREVVVQTARVDANNDWEITIEDQFIDAGDFAQNLIDHPEIPPGVKAAAQEFIDAIDQATLVNEQRSGAPFDGGQEWDLQALTGQSLYFPLADEWRRGMYGPVMLPNFAGSTRWDDFIQSWYAELPAPEPPTEPCPECPIPPMSVSLSIGGAEIIPVDQTVYVPVFINKVRQQDDVRGVQVALRSSKPELLSPLQSMKQPARIGDFFAEESYMDAVPTNDTWSFVLNAPPPPAHAAEGSGIIVELPFKAKGTGCVTLEFTEHLIVTSTTGEVNHHAATRTICITDGGVITGTVYLESRTAGHYGDTQVVLSDGHRKYTTTTEPDGTFTLAGIAEGDYTLTVFRRLFITAIREVKLDGVETTVISDIGLWAGDMNEDNAVTRHDWYICAAASIPVNDPDFDLNADGVTNVRDCTIVANNIGRQDMETTNPSRTKYTTLPSPDTRSLPVQAGTVLPLVGSGEPVLIPQDEQNLLVRLTEVNEPVRAIGMRFAVPAGTVVTSVEPRSIFESAFLSWHQDGDTLYIITVLDEEQVVTQDTDVVLIRGITEAELEGTNLVSADGPIFSTYLPFIQK